MHGPLAAGLSLAVKQGPQGMQASVVAARGLQGSGSGVLVHELGEPQHVGSSQTRDRMYVCCIGRWILYHWATKEALVSLFISG